MARFKSGIVLKECARWSVTHLGEFASMHLTVEAPSAVVAKRIAAEKFGCEPKDVDARRLA